MEVMIAAIWSDLYLLCRCCAAIPIHSPIPMRIVAGIIAGANGARLWRPCVDKSENEGQKPSLE
jgi:hypothetical protein